MPKKFYNINIKPGILRISNALAYYAVMLITTQKSFFNNELWA